MAVPKHVGIIMDGNRRFAKRLMLEPWKGHEWGKKKLEEVIDYAHDLGILELTLFAFSIQNFKRPKKEFDFLMKLFKEACNDLLKDVRIEKYKIRVRFIGRIQMFPDELADLMRQVMDKTQGNDKFFLNLAMAYGGREEIVDAIKKISRNIKEGKLDPEKIDEETIANNLYIKSQPDLIIRTGEEKRISNFLLWQGNYAELIFLDKHWPEFTKKDFEKCIKEYDRRERRFGK
jgi:tritrans,polycis-undecaprenyl-diphosphate synthase [geranylgeranyl-diphosphate specific]